MTNYSTNPDFNPSKSNKVHEIKTKTDELIDYIEYVLPEGRHKALALTNYELAAMWAVKAVFDNG